MKAKFFVSCLVLLAGLFISAVESKSALIDFETVPGVETLGDELPISTQFEAAYGVTFSLDDGTTPYLEAVGEADSGNGFKRQVGDVAYDQARAGHEAELGNYFLRLWTGELGSSATQLIISYTNPVSAASAQIWDIDARVNGYEKWLVRAWDADNNIIDSLSSPEGLLPSLPGSLDSLPWTWSFDHGTTADIHKVTLDFDGQFESGATGGLAFDNFSPSSPVAPEPVSSILFLTGGAALGLRRFFKIKKAS